MYLCNLICVDFNDTSTNEIYTYLQTLALHDALPISHSIYIICVRVYRADSPVSIFQKILASPMNISFPGRFFAAWLVLTGLAMQATDRKSTRLNSSH